MFSNQDCMTVPLWPFIDKVMWLRHPNDMQVGASYHNPRPVQVQRYMGDLVCNGDNAQANHTVMIANKFINLNNSSHPHLPTWGANVCDLNNV